MKKKTEKNKDMGKGDGSIGHQQAAVCLGIKDGTYNTAKYEDKSFEKVENLYFYRYTDNVHQ